MGAASMAHTPAFRRTARAQAQAQAVRADAARVLHRKHGLLHGVLADRGRRCRWRWDPCEVLGGRGGVACGARGQAGTAFHRQHPQHPVGADVQGPAQPLSTAVPGHAGLDHLSTADRGHGLPVGGLAAPAAQGRHGGLQQVLRRQFDPADGQPQFTWLQGAGVGRIGIERPAQLPLRGTADQQAKPAVGSAQVRSGPRAAHRPDGDGGVHSRVTPGRCPTSWPSTYSAPSGAPASA